MRDPALYEKEETDSTQNDARGLIEKGEAVHGDICTALYQSAGRGRISGRIWEGEKDAALMFTLILEKDKTPASPPLSLLLGLALALTLEEDFSLLPRIKWPNDVYLEGKKCAGILCESEKKYWLCGMGINLNQASFPEELREKAQSLYRVLGKKVDGKLFLPSLKNRIFELLTRPAEEIIGEIGRRLLWKGEEKTLLLGDPARREELVGTVEGINPDGALLIGTPGGLRQIYSAEFPS